MPVRRKRIAVLLASVDREYQQDFAMGLASAASQNDVDICIFNCQGHTNVNVSTSESGENAIFDLPNLQDFDGIISLQETLAGEETQKKVRQLLEENSNIPHVAIDVNNPDAVSILFDDAISIQEVTAHLIHEHGARRLAFVSGPMDQAVPQARLEAFRETIRKTGLDLVEDWIFEGEWTRTSGRKAAEKLLNQGGMLPDAIVCANDDMAFGVMEFLQEQGIRTPRDIAVVGFDSLREAVMRGLTTVCRPIDRAARKAVQILTHWIDGEEPTERLLKLPTIPIYGESCGCNQSLEHMNEKLRALGTERRNMESILARVSIFSGTLAGVLDEQDAYEKIKEFTEYWGIDELFLCVDQELCRPDVEEHSESEGYPEQMMLLYGRHNGKDYPAELFDTRHLVPCFDESRKAPLCLVFCPLYYRGRSFGYVAMSLGSATGAALYSVLMLLNGALMSLYLQTSAKRYAAALSDMAIRDVMTGMLNRRGFMERAPLEMSIARQNEEYFAVLSIDMDSMKETNDRFGHLAGDEAIMRMGKALRVLEKLGVTPVHISGDEFVAYGRMKTREDTERILPMIREEIERMNREDPWIMKLGASMGVYAAVPEEGQELDRFLTNADREMYAVKQERKRKG